jgi:hypothetical protein
VIGGIHPIHIKGKQAVGQVKANGLDSHSDGVHLTFLCSEYGRVGQSDSVPIDVKPYRWHFFGFHRPNK